MKIRILAAVLLALLTGFLLMGCAAGQTAEAPGTTGTGENLPPEQMQEPPVQTAAPTLPASAETVPGTSLPGNTAGLITPEEAQAIALDHSGFTPEQVTRLHTEFEIDHRIPHYDVSFHEGRWEYEYEIHGETGEILSFEKDD